MAKAPYEVLIIAEHGGLRTEVDTRNGRIRRLDTPTEPSDGWRMLGLDEARPFGRMARSGIGGPAGIAANLEQLRRVPGLTYANGKPRFFVRDLDHGTQRVRMAGVVDIAREWRNADGSPISRPA